MSQIKVTVWNEFQHERKHESIAKIYPKGMHGAIADYLNRRDGMVARTAALDEPEQGLSDEVLDGTDVLVWWGHVAHDQVLDETVDRVQARVLQCGMGLIVLHSGHKSKIFMRLMGTTGNLRWRVAHEKERLWVVNPYHPITAGLGEYIELPQAEMYGEHFDIPEPEELIFISWFEGGEVFRSGAVWTRGRGKIFYFRPGHETYPLFHNEQVLHVIENAVRWAKFAGNESVVMECRNPEPANDANV